MGSTHSFAYWQKRILWGATFAYTIYYFCRVNISIAIPLMQKSLGASKTELGFIASALQISYGTGKFVNGIIGDRSNPRYFMAAGLLLSGVANLAFSRTTALGALAIIWALNGWFQSMGFPSGARLLSHYYKRKEHGRSWTIFGCSHQVGAYLILVAGGYLGLLGWRDIFAAPGLVAILCSIAVVAILRDVPQKNKDLGQQPATPSVRPPLWTGLRDHHQSVDRGARNRESFPLHRALWAADLVGIVSDRESRDDDGASRLARRDFRARWTLRRVERRMDLRRFLRRTAWPCDGGLHAPAGMRSRVYGLRRHTTQC
jgi:MFS family permease